jgi:hypothetical protein
LLTDFMSVCSILGFLAATAIHAVVLSGVLVPTSALQALLISIFPIGIMVVLTHPTRRWTLSGAEAEIDTDKTPLWLDIMLYGSFAYTIVLWALIPEHRFSISGHLDQAHQLIASWVPALFFVGFFALRWTARQLNGP